MADHPSVSTGVNWQAYRREFPIFSHTTYFNTCSLGALSTRVASAVRSFTELWDARGAAAWYGPWLAEIETLRGRFAGLIGAEPDEVGIFPSVTSALTAVASCFDYRRRSKVVLSELEFPTTVYQWLVKAPHGVAVQMLPPAADRLSVPLEAYERAADTSTQLVVGSHVYFTSGVIQDIAGLARLAHAKGAYCLIDAYQSVGQLPVDVHAAGVDFLITGGLKWLLGGPGIAYLYVRKDVTAALQPTDVGWFAHRRQFAFDVGRFEYADGARGFEGGTPSVAAVYAGSAGLDIVGEIGVDVLRRRQVELVRHLVEGARRAGWHARLPGRVEQLAGIVTIPRDDPQAVVAALAQQHIIVDSRPGVVRLSPYFYNTTEDIDRTVETMAELEQRGIR